MTERQDQHPIPLPDRPRLPAGYGVPSHRRGLLSWGHVEGRLIAAGIYWVGTTLPDGSPHVVPLWGVWSDGRLFFGTDPETRTARNLAQNPEVVVHLESGEDVVILKGAVVLVTDREVLRHIAALGAAKYGGPVPDDDSAAAHPAYALRPRVAYAWTNLGKDATRWRFDTS